MRLRPTDISDPASSKSARRSWVVVPIMMAAALAAIVALISQTAADTPFSRSKIPALLSAGSATPERHMTSAECLRCHTVDADFSHPVGVRPSMSVPSSLPLQGGLVTCVTCHEDTTSAHAQNRNAAVPDGLLRAPWNEGGVVFCAQCHRGQSVTRKSMHPTGLDRAHLTWRAPAFGSNKMPTSRQLATATRATDDGSRSCITCHDGSVASDATGGSGTSGFGHSNGHPFGMPYQQTRDARGDRRGDMNLRSAATLNSRIRLFNGQVSCQSCHSPYSTQRGLLVLSNDSSKLCLSCHEQP